MVFLADSEIWLQRLHLERQVYEIDSNISASVHNNEGTCRPVHNSVAR